MSAAHHENTSSSSGIAGPTDRFWSLSHLTNHWSRPATSRSYYWYLTFENSPELLSFVKQCQKEISFPYYDLIPASGLHLTLDRIAFEGDITLDQLRALEAAATRACDKIPPLTISVGHVGGTSGAIGFSASPKEPIRSLRDTLREISLAIYPNAPIVDSEFLPHVAMAYCNTDAVPAAQVIESAERLSALPCVDVAVHESALVLLERRKRAYVWQTIARIALSG